MDLAAMIERGEMVTVPALARELYLFGIGQRATEEAFCVTQTIAASSSTTSHNSATLTNNSMKSERDSRPTLRR